MTDTSVIDEEVGDGTTRRLIRGHDRIRCFPYK